MRAVVLTEYGDADVLRVAEVPEPEIGPEEVIVEVVATALNRADLLQRRGDQLQVIGRGERGPAGGSRIGANPDQGGMVDTLGTEAGRNQEGTTNRYKEEG